MTERSFSELVDMLTRETYATVEHDDGARIHRGDSLLAQLRDSVFGGMSGGGGAQGKVKLPLAAAALDLVCEIEYQAAEAFALAAPQATRPGRAEDAIQRWSALVLESTPVTVTARETVSDHVAAMGRAKVFRARRELSAHALAGSWVRSIEEYFSPPLRIPILAACPRLECEQRYVYRGGGGNEVRSDALSVHFDRETRHPLGASCAACGERWSLEQLPRLAELCGFTPDEAAVATLLHAAL